MGLSERELIEKIRSRLPHNQADIIKAIGDDCAVVRGAGNELLLYTVDTMVEEVHFDKGWHPPYLLGKKAAAVNLSDIGAMGGSPRYALLSIAAPPSMEEKWFDAFMEGFLERLSDSDASLLGGDTVKSNSGIIISVTLMGNVHSDHILFRDGARPGDLIWLSGLPGKAAAGLALCQAGQRDNKKWATLIAAHLDPIPEVQLGAELANSGLVTAMLDTSDGVATDLAHICKESVVGAEINETDLPRNELLGEAADLTQSSILDWMLKGGEDYLLLFTSPIENREALVKLVRENFKRKIYCVGRITEGQGVFLVNGDLKQDISYQGYDHFAK